jgi:hypothetical protein
MDGLVSNKHLLTGCIFDNSNINNRNVENFYHFLPHVLIPLFKRLL